MKDDRLYMRFPMAEGPNGDLANPELVRVGRAFQVNWAFVSEQPTSYVYEVSDKHHRVVYVGVTDWFPARWSAHLRSSWWATSVDIRCVMLTGFRSRSEARTTEALLIAKHQPPCNVKPERKYLRIGQTKGSPVEVFAAELQPRRKF